MTQETRVYRADASQARALEQTLTAELSNTENQWRTVPYARFSVKALGVVLTCYESGKVVLQGQNLDPFEARFLAPLAKGPAKATHLPVDLQFDRPTVASDEAGKGDYFGPLVVAAVYARPADLERLQKIGVVDSKTLSDDRARRLAGILENEFDHSIESLGPQAYNAAHHATKNVNVILADLHATVLASLIERHPDVELAIVDRFGAEKRVEQNLRERAPVMPRLVQVPRAEQNPVVAAASIIARARFLDGLAECADGCGCDLPKGAGDPVDRAARRVVDIGGRALLETVAKVHFRNTSKIGGQL